MVNGGGINGSAVEDDEEDEVWLMVVPMVQDGDGK